jgi:hypothetical protein
MRRRLGESIFKCYIAGPVSDVAVAEAGLKGLDDLGSFGWPRGVRDWAIMPELLWHKDVSVSAFSCLAGGPSWMLRKGSPCIWRARRSSLPLLSQRRGRPIGQLFAGIERHGVPWIQEAGGSMAMVAAKGMAIVGSISVKPYGLASEQEN